MFRVRFICAQLRFGKRPSSETLSRLFARALTYRLIVSRMSVRYALGSTLKRQKKCGAVRTLAIKRSPARTPSIAVQQQSFRPSSVKRSLQRS